MICAMEQDRLLSEGRTPGTLWRPAATSLEEYLEDAGKLEYVRALAADPPHPPNPNLPGFANEGGIRNKGVCWWHSRLTRSAIYLAWFDPGGRRPDERSAKRIVESLLNAERVVSIPGYSNLRDFTLDNRRLVQERLDAAQLREGIFLFQWVNGLAGRSRVPPPRLKAMMDRIHSEVSTEGLSYVKLQVPGIDAHSWIMTEMVPFDGGGYKCRFLDSNCQGAKTWDYRPGAERISIQGMGDFGVPYLQRSRELRTMKRLIARFVESRRYPGASDEALHTAGIRRA
jgi:hypothetical protein